MTKQTRSHRLKELAQYHNLDPETNFGPVIKRADSKLGEYGLSIYREIVDDGQLDEIKQLIRDICGWHVTEMRGQYTKDTKVSIGPAVNIVEKREVERIFSNLGNYAVQAVNMDDINDYLFHNVPSLRKRVKFRPNDVEIFGRNNSPNRVIGITIDEPANTQVSHERSTIIDGFNGLYYINRQEECNIGFKLLHGSIAKFKDDTPEYKVEEMKYAIREKLSSIDQLTMEKAEIYYPGANKR